MTAVVAPSAIDRSDHRLPVSLAGPSDRRRVGAGQGRQDVRDRQPGDRERLAEVATATRTTSTAPSRPARRRSTGPGARTRRPRAAPVQARRPDRGARRGARRSSRRSTTASRSATRRRSTSPSAVDDLRYFAGWATKINGETQPIPHGQRPRLHAARAGRRGRRRSCRGTSRCMMAVWKIAPALAAGYTVVLKPAEQTPLTALRLGELIAEAGIPRRRRQRRHRLRRDAGAALVEHPGVDKIAFTGSTEVGKAIVRGVGRQPQARHARARRQVAGHRLRRRRPRRRDRGAASGDLRQHRPGAASPARACSSHAGRSSTRSSTASPSVAQGSSSARASTRARRWARWSRRSSSTASPATSSRARGGRHGRHRRQRARPTAAISSSRPCSTGTHADMRSCARRSSARSSRATPFDDDDLDADRAAANDTDYGLAADIWTRDISTAPTSSREAQGRHRLRSTAAGASTRHCPSAASSSPAGAARTAARHRGLHRDQVGLHRPVTCRGAGRRRRSAPRYADAGRAMCEVE